MGNKYFLGWSKKVLLLAFFVLTPFQVRAATYTEVKYEERADQQYYLTSQTLTKDKSPYILYGGCAWGRVPSYATVIIEAGVVVKFDEPRYCYGGTISAGLWVYGNLVVNGTAEEPVVFTSNKDDTVGGDTNGDGSASAPMPGDWGSIEIGPGLTNNIEINNAIIRYGVNGIRAAKVYNETNITLKNLDISSNRSYGLYSSIPVSISNSRFHDNVLGAVNGDLYWNPQITAINNWWGNDSGPTTASNPEGVGEKIFGNVLYDPWIGKISNVAPVLSFPSDDTDGVEPNIDYLPEQPTFRIVYSDANNDVPANVNVVINTTTYSMTQLVSTFDFTSGSIYIFTPPTSTLQKGDYSFYFEASDGVVTTTLPSQSEIKQNFVVKNRPVIVVPGIMGSEQKNGVWVMDPILHTYDNLLDTFRANGYTDGDDLFTFPYQWRQSNVLTAVQLKHKIDEVKGVSRSDKVNLVAHSMGGLVSRQYIQSDAYTQDVDQLIFMGTPHLGAPKAYLMWEAGEFPNTVADRFIKLLLKVEAYKLNQSLFEYIQNGSAPSLEQLLPIYNYLVNNNTLDIISYPIGYPKNYFLENLKNKIGLLNDSGIRVLNIIGEQSINQTVYRLSIESSQILPLWKNGIPYDFYNTALGIKIGIGDGTVPVESSISVSENSLVADSEHRILPTYSSGFAVTKLVGLNNPIVIDKIKFPSARNLLFIKILSPADIVIIAPDGKRIGKDFVNGSEVNEIDGAFYSGFETEDEYVTIPNPVDGEYRVETQGTGDGGQYTIAAGYISNTTSSEKIFVGHILPGQITGVEIKIDSEQLNNLEIKPADQTPPVIEILSPSSSNYLRSASLLIKVNISDLETGVFSQEIRLDDTMIKNGDSIDLFYKKLGRHTIFVSSSDFQGNNSSSSTSFRVIATPSSTIADLERAYTLGWIKSLPVKKDFVSKLLNLFPNLNCPLGTNVRVCGLVKILKQQLGKLIIDSLIYQLKIKNINQQAYDILKEDIEWLINN